MATPVICAVLLILSFSGISSRRSSSRDDVDWFDDWFGVCPDENPHTHMCSSRTTTNSTCVSIFPCRGESTETTLEDMFTDEECDWFGDGFCTLLCVTNSTCTVSTCARYCCDGWVRDHGSCTEKSDGRHCSNGGTRMPNDNGDESCVCSRNFTGEHCEIPICHCQNGGVCYANNNRTTCDCKSGFWGERCEQSSCMLACENGGSCVTDGARQYCVCPQYAAGPLCEHLYTNDEQCPDPEYHNGCWEQCSSNSDCADHDEICCSDGCSMLCKRPKSRTCVHEGRPMAVGTVFKPDSCTTCNCSSNGEVVCYTIDCLHWNHICSGYTQPEYIPGECCPVCPDERHPAPEIDCPDIVSINVSQTGSVAYLDSSKVIARDYTGDRLKVTFKPASFTHCRCRSLWKNKYVVTATAVDSSGQGAACGFTVHVKDRYPPVISSCMEDVYVFEDEFVELTKPEAWDNVGVYYTNYISQITVYDNMRAQYPHGYHHVRYEVMDYDMNIASCAFIISVSSRDTNFEDLPEGLRQRSHDKDPMSKDNDKDPMSIVAIVAPIAGLIPVVIIITAIVILLYRRRTQRRARRARASSLYTSAPVRAAGRPKPTTTFENTIYTVCGPPDMTLPAYSPPTNPPPYDADKGEEYSYVAPPTYEEAERAEGGGNNLYDTLDDASITTTGNQ